MSAPTDPVPSTAVAGAVPAPRTSPEAAPAPIHGMVDVEPGVRIHYVVAGDGPRAVVLLHGFPETCLEWRKVVRRPHPRCPPRS